MKQNLGIGLGPKAIAFRLKFMSQFAEIVDLAIEGQYVAIASVHHRLMTARAEINDAEPIVADSKASGRVNKLFQHRLARDGPSRPSSDQAPLDRVQLEDLPASRLSHTFGQNNPALAASD